jgi:hypothetical protein
VLSGEMAEPAPAPELSPAEEAVALLERLAPLIRDSIVYTPDGPLLDLDFLTRLLVARGIDYKDVNRTALFTELTIVREEHHSQRVKSENEINGVKRQEYDQRRRVLKRREKEILDQLWPIS